MESPWTFIAASGYRPDGDKAMMYIGATTDEEDKEQDR